MATVGHTIYNLQTIYDLLGLIEKIRNEEFGKIRVRFTCIKETPTPKVWRLPNKNSNEARGENKIR